MADNRRLPPAETRQTEVVAATVLIVDDNPRFRSRARRWLESGGWSVIGEAADGGEALDAVARHRPTVVLLDVQLPDMSGMAVSEQVMQQDDPPAIVLTSTHDEADFGTRIADCGARGFLPKAEFSSESFAAILACQ
jgi:DNA-binding NarL/FixJ family response regulator